MQKILLVVIMLFVSIPGFTQPVSKGFIKKVDSIFSEFNQNTPGAAFAIVTKDTTLIRNYGMANLEHRIPINSQTVFNLASLSKQFTGMGIALLAKQGKIDLHEDIRKYLSWVPDFKQRITVNHLLHHTSGIRDHLVMSLLGGVPSNGMITQEVATKYIRNYEALNFNPGESHAYSNSNYVLLAEIIKKVSGQSFKQFMDSAIFKPLGMKTSAVIEPNTLINNGASSYSNIGNAFNQMMLNVYTHGDGGLTSTIDDMSMWIRNFLDPKVGDEKMIKQLAAPFLLNNGKKTNYGMGIGAVSFQGNTQYTHSGSIAGFRSVISIYPDLGFGTIVLSNYANGRAATKAAQAVEYYLKEINAFKENKPATGVVKSNFTDSVLAKKISGNYLAENGERFTFNYKDGQLLFQNNKPVTVKSANEWSLAEDTTATFMVKMNSKDTTIQHFALGTNYIFTKYRVDSVMSAAMLQEYTGNYYNKELDLTINLTVKNGQLYLSNFLLGEISLQPLTKNDFFFKNGVTHLRMLRNANKKIDGLEYSNSVLTKLRFVKR